MRRGETGARLPVTLVVNRVKVRGGALSDVGVGTRDTSLAGPRLGKGVNAPLREDGATRAEVGGPPGIAAPLGHTLIAVEGLAARPPPRLHVDAEGGPVVRVTVDVATRPGLFRPSDAVLVTVNADGLGVSGDRDAVRLVARLVLPRKTLVILVLGRVRE